MSLTIRSNKELRTFSRLAFLFSLLPMLIISNINCNNSKPQKEDTALKAAAGPVFDMKDSLQAYYLDSASFLALESSPGQRYKLVFQLFHAKGNPYLTLAVYPSGRHHNNSDLSKIKYAQPFKNVLSLMDKDLVLADQDMTPRNYSDLYDEVKADSVKYVIFEPVIKDGRLLQYEVTGKDTLAVGQLFNQKVTSTYKSNPCPPAQAQ